MAKFNYNRTYPYGRYGSHRWDYDCDQDKHYPRSSGKRGPKQTEFTFKEWYTKYGSFCIDYLTDQALKDDFRKFVRLWEENGMDFVTQEHITDADKYLPKTKPNKQK